MDNEKIKEYYDSCNVYSIETLVKSKLENGKKNHSYFYDTSNEREKLFNKIIDENNFFDLETKNRLKQDNRDCTFLFENIVLFYDRICQYYKAIQNNEVPEARAFKSSIPLFQIKINQTFANFEYQKFFIIDLVNDEKFKTAIKVRDFFTHLLEWLLLHFKQYLNMDLLKSPFKDVFNPHLNMLSNSVNINEINLMLKIEANKNEQQLLNDEVHVNVKNDDKIWISREEIERLKLENIIVNFNFTVGTSGYHQVNTNKGLLKIYTVELAQILLAEKLNAEIITKGKKREKTVIKDCEYFNSYEIGYYEGREYFKKTYSKNNIEDLRIRYHKDWCFAKNGYPWTFSQTRAKEYGYASGIISKIEDIQNEYPSIFVNFFEKNHNKEISKLKEEHKSTINRITLEDDIEKSKAKPKEKWYALLYWITINAKGLQPPKTLEGEFDKKKLIAIGIKMSGRKGQGFYTEFRKIADWLNDEKLLNNNFPDWKTFIVELSNNDETVIKYLKTNYRYNL